MPLATGSSVQPGSGQAPGLFNLFNLKSQNQAALQQSMPKQAESEDANKVEAVQQ